MNGGRKAEKKRKIYEKQRPRPLSFPSLGPNRGLNGNHPAPMAPAAVLHIGDNEGLPW